jgi:hypothetical protein
MLGSGDPPFSLVESEYTPLRVKSRQNYILAPSLDAKLPLVTSFHSLSLAAIGRDK